MQPFDTTAPRDRPANRRAIAAARALVAAVACLVVLLASPARAGDDVPSIVIDRQSGEVLLDNRPFDRWYPASLTKLMTVYVTLRAIAAGEVEPGSPVIVSKAASRQPPSRMGFKPGTRLRVDNALPILVIKSANDVAVAVAESIAGSEPAFVERMNAEAARLGMADTHFANPNGLHSADNYSSARDLALLARHLLNEFPQYAHLFAVPAIRYGNDLDYSYNLLLQRFAGADGMKTGFVCASGYNFVASATRDGRQLVAVLLGEFSQTDRAVDAARLLLEGFERTGGPRIESFVRSGPPIEPASQRDRICSEQAWKQRYDPGAGQAKIDSPLLQADLPAAEPITVTTGGTDADPSGAWLAAHLTPQGEPPAPTKRPQYPPAPAAAPQVPAETERPVLSAGSVPVPTPRPVQ